MRNRTSSYLPIQPVNSVKSCFQIFVVFSLFLSLFFSAFDKFLNLVWLMSLLFHSFLKKKKKNCSVEKTVRNGYKTTKLQLSASLKEITDQIELLMVPLGKRPTFDILPSSIENNYIIKSITLNRQCERFLYDLLNTLTDHQMHIDRCLKNFRSQLNRIHEIVKFRTAIPITSIFVSIFVQYFFFLFVRHFTPVCLQVSDFKHIIFN